MSVFEDLAGLLGIGCAFGHARGRYVQSIDAQNQALLAQQQMDVNRELQLRQFGAGAANASTCDGCGAPYKRPCEYCGR